MNPAPPNPNSSSPASSAGGAAGSSAGSATTSPAASASGTAAAPGLPAGSSPTFSPLYQQIKALITQSLQSGEWKPGELIPSEVELANRFKVSQGTVRKAIDELAAENLVMRTVPWLTLKRLASSTSLGINSPGFHSPDCRL